MNVSANNTYTGKSNHRPTTFWFVIDPEGNESGLEHSRVSDVISELMEIDAVATEVNDRMRGQAQYDWEQEDEQAWIWQNCAPIAKELGYRINKVMR